MWVAGAVFKCKFSIYFQFNNLCVGVYVCGAAEGFSMTPLRDFIREEVHDVVMMCESWRRRRMMRSLPGNHIPTFRVAKVLNQIPELCMLCVREGEYWLCNTKY